MSRRPDLIPTDVPPGYFRMSRWMPDRELFLTWRTHFNQIGIAHLLVHAMRDGRRMVSLWREGEESVSESGHRMRELRAEKNIANRAGDPQP